MTSHLDKAEDVNFIIKTAIERDPNKRRVKPVETQASILDFDLGESSDDSDFRIEDHPDVSDDDSIDSNGDGENSEESEEEDESETSDLEEFKGINNATYGLSIPNNTTQNSITNISKANIQFNEKDAQVMICCGCLGDQSDGVNEIVECDSCGVTVHEACYGVSDTTSLSSTDSLSPTAPWFCEACKAGVIQPVCELCPNSGGIFKETDVGKWVHLVCALYVPGVAFGEVDKLSSVTLFEMPYNKWGAKTCSLCQDERFSRTGVCIGCDAGMCRTYFHVTCAQREGFLSEAHSEEQDQADPFYAHCKLHSDKTLVKRRRRNYLALQLRMHYRKLQFEKEGHSSTPEQLRIQRKLEKHQLHYHSMKSLKTPPWVPTQKMPRLLTTSASACKKLIKKAELMGINTAVLEMQESHLAALADIRKKWHIPPAFTVEFIAYYLDRNDRLKGMKETLEKFVDSNQILLEEQQALRNKYDLLVKENGDVTQLNLDIKQQIQKYHSAILSACPTKKLPNIDDIGKPPPKQIQPMMVPTAAALKMGVGFPISNIAVGRSDLNNINNQNRQDALLLNECGICQQKRDQHLLVKCDTCHLYYHLNCLNPPLTRPPKKSKLYGWQCSECDKSSDSELEQVKSTRRSRSKYTKDSKELFTPKVKIKPVEPNPEDDKQPAEEDMNFEQTTESVAEEVKLNDTEINDEQNNTFNSSIEVTNSYSILNNTGEDMVISSKSSKKRRREKHRNRYSPDTGIPIKEHKRKRKKKSLDIDSSSPPTIPHPRITIKIKPIPMPAGEVASSTNPQRFYVPKENDNTPPPPPTTTTAATTTTRIIRRESITKDVKETTPVTPVTKNKNEPLTNCDVCQGEGSNANLVRCDECQKCYHFTCLEPPVKKTPKRRGYSWHCADCDPTGSE